MYGSHLYTRGARYQGGRTGRSLLYDNRGGSYVVQIERHEWRCRFWIFWRARVDESRHPAGDGHRKKYQLKKIQGVSFLPVFFSLSRYENFRAQARGFRHALGPS